MTRYNHNSVTWIFHSVHVPLTRKHYFTVIKVDLNIKTASLLKDQLVMIQKMNESFHSRLLCIQKIKIHGIPFLFCRRRFIHCSVLHQKYPLRQEKNISGVYPNHFLLFISRKFKYMTTTTRNDILVVNTNKENIITNSTYITKKKNKQSFSQYTF